MTFSTLLRPIFLAMTLFSGAVLAAPEGSAPASSSAPTLATSAADAQAVGAKLKAKYPKLQLLSVTRLPIGETPLYEFLASGLVGYTDHDVNYILMGGNLISGTDRTLVNITQERAKSSATDLVRSLPRDRTFKEVFGKGERPLLVFSDPDCPFCQQLEQGFAKIGDKLNATLYIFPYPLTEIHPDAERKSRHIACTADPSKAWQDWMRAPKDWDTFVASHPAPATCPGAAIVDQAQAIGRGLMFDKTPTLLFHNGMVLQRAPTEEEILKALDYVAEHPDDVQSLNPVVNQPMAQPGK